MMKTIGSITYNLGLRQSTVRHFCNDFGIPFYDQFIGKPGMSNSILKDNFISYITDNVRFLLDYQHDYYSDKTPQIIADTIKRDIKILEPFLKKEYSHYFNDGIFNNDSKLTFRYVSSYKIDYELGGDYSFLNLNLNADLNKESEYLDLKIVGYQDVLLVINEQLEPILNPEDMKDWGMVNPGGIILFGPPGCGKTFWAEKISNLIDYKFEEIPRSIFGSSLVDGAMINLKKKLNEYKHSSKTVLFFDEFDSVASIRNNLSTSSTENSKVVNTLLQEIPKLIDKQVLIVAATNFLEIIDPAVIRPGRFDLKIPVFPPNIEERAFLIVNKLVTGLDPMATLLQILRFNNADNPSFWKKLASDMVLFSNSLVIDFTQLIKRKLKGIYREKSTIEIKIEESLITSTLAETSSKLTRKDAEAYAHFYNEVNGLGSLYYQERLDWLFQDLQRYYSRFESSEKPRPIGFRQPNIE